MKKELKEGFVFYLDQIRENVTSLGKWLLLAVLTGCVVGGASTLFAFVLTAVTSFRQENGWVFFLLPVAGLIIVFLYQTFWKMMEEPIRSLPRSHRETMCPFARLHWSLSPRR